MNERKSFFVQYTMHQKSMIEFKKVVPFKMYIYPLQNHGALYFPYRALICSKLVVVFHQWITITPSDASSEGMTIEIETLQPLL